MSLCPLRGTGRPLCPLRGTERIVWALRATGKEKSCKWSFLPPGAATARLFLRAGSTAEVGGALHLARPAVLADVAAGADSSTAALLALVPIVHFAMAAAVATVGPRGSGSDNRRHAALVDPFTTFDELCNGYVTAM